MHRDGERRGGDAAGGTQAVSMCVYVCVCGYGCALEVCVQSVGESWRRSDASAGGRVMGGLWLGGRHGGLTALR